MLSEEEIKRYVEHREKEKTKAYGCPGVRAQKRQKYIGDLVKSHSEELVRLILKALSQVDKFIPSRGLKEVDLASVPLEEVMRIMS